MRAPTRPLPALSGILATALLAAGCGGSAGAGYGNRHPDYAAALAGSPPPLAALHRQADQLIPGGREAFERRIAQLHGYPVVANVWASWCLPCRQEFPVLQKLAARYGKEVAFVGIDAEDSNDAAATFLREEPVPYPSYTDPDKRLAESIGVRGYPDTAFYDRGGKLVYLKQGPYASGSELEADVRRYTAGGA